MEPLQPEVGSREQPGSSWCGTGDRIVAGVGFPAPVRAAKWSGSNHLRTSVRRAIIPDTGLPQELAKQMREVTRQIAGLTNELERLLPRDRYIRDRPTNAPPAGCSDDSALSTVASMVDSARCRIRTYSTSPRHSRARRRSA